MTNKTSQKESKTVEIISQTGNTNDKKILKKKGEKSSKKKEVPVEQETVPIKEEVEEELVEEVIEEVADETPGTKKRIIINKESIMNSFDEIISSIENEISQIRDSSNKNKGIKFLRSLNKKIKTLKTHSFKIIKTRNSSTKKSNNNNSGFLKPVKISNEMAKFTGWNANELRSRVDVTKFLCNYIKENNLQNPTDKRQIIADNKLCKLLDYDPKKMKEPLTYYRIQSYIKPHFVKV
jgi:chromatin remodeling complex protein RSC6